MKTKIITILMLLSAIKAHAGVENAVLDGHYLMKLKIGNKIFHDEVDIKGVGRPILLRAYSGKIEGTLTVPGIFTSLLGGSASCTSWGGYCRLEFSIVANENGQSYEVNYKADLKFKDYMNVVNNNAEPFLTGEARLKDGKLLGTFEATRK